MDLGVWTSICTQVYQCDPARAPVVLDEIGRQFGAELAEQEQRQHPIADEPLYDITSYLSEMGVGRFDFSPAQAKDFAARHADTLEIRVKDCAFAKVNLGGESPLCHFAVGLLKGALTVLQGEVLRAWEESCASKGDAVCEIVVAWK